MTRMRRILGNLKFAIIAACLAISTSVSAQDDTDLSETDFAQLLASDDTDEMFEYLSTRGIDLDERHDDVLAVSDRLCVLEQRGGCVLAAEIRTNSPINSEEFDNAEAVIREQCRQNYIPACQSLARFFRTHEGTDEAHALALRMDEYLCEQDFLLSCVTAGGIHRRGLHTESDYERASELYEIACQDNYFESCYWYAVTRRGSIRPLNRSLSRGREPIDPQIWLETHRLLEPLCFDERTYARACYLLASDYFRGDGVAENRARSIELFERACSMGHSGSCIILEAAE